MEAADTAGVPISADDRTVTAVLVGTAVATTAVAVESAGRLTSAGALLVTGEFTKPVSTLFGEVAAKATSGLSPRRLVVSRDSSGRLLSGCFAAEASSSSSADAAPARPGVVDVTAPPELSTCIPPVTAEEPSEPPASADPPEPSLPVDAAPADESDVSVGSDVAVEPEPAVEPSDDAGEPASGSADATPGVLATAIPTPSATANPPTRPMYLA